jgi:hypothetical protein
MGKAVASVITVMGTGTGVAGVTMGSAPLRAIAKIRPQTPQASRLSKELDIVMGQMRNRAEGMKGMGYGYNQYPERVWRLRLEMGGFDAESKPPDSYQWWREKTRMGHYPKMGEGQRSTSCSNSFLNS